MTHLPRHPKRAKLDRGSVSNGHYVTTAKDGSRESRQQNAFPDRAFIGSVLPASLSTWVACCSVLHGPLGQFRRPCIGVPLDNGEFSGRKTHPFRPREHLPGSLITNSMHRHRLSLSRRALAWNVFISRRRALLPFLLLISSLLYPRLSTSISIVDRAMTRISDERCDTTADASVVDLTS